ncbi:MAG: thiamine pyrophosphate-binding protein, partial [Pelagibacterales bacterium]|nr:thiamine pyrophosphate-binding protein [Pelagibacterales bacterium]
MIKNSYGGKVLADCIKDLGIKTIFTVPGESFLPALNGLYDHKNSIKVITCRHESGAANMAEAWGKLTGFPGIAFVTRGPGACHASIGIHTAMQDSSPMILFIGQINSKHKGREAFQEVDYFKMFGPPFSKGVFEITQAKNITN